MGEKEEAIKQLAETLFKSGLATNPAEAMEKARASFGAEEILKKVQSVDPFLKEQKTVTEILNGTTNEPKEAELKSSEIKEPIKEAQIEPKDKNDIKINIFNPGMINTNLATNAKVIEAWKDKETYDREFELIKKYVMTDIEESCSKVIPYALPSCNNNGKSFRGFSGMKLGMGFNKIRKELKKM